MLIGGNSSEGGDYSLCQRVVVLKNIFKIQNEFVCEMISCLFRSNQQPISPSDKGGTISAGNYRFEAPFDKIRKVEAQGMNKISCLPLHS
jgi:hypothetical protein